ncbi:MAG: MFS transporter [Firmicutes bacterium]|nr:MFS transporter [Bacillota bacterium]
MENPSAENRKQQFLVFVVATLVLILSAVNSTIVATALSDIQKSLGSDLNWTGWVISAYLLMNVTVMPLMGRISDEWGRKRVFLVCLVVFTLSSLLCAISPNIYCLIAFRALQALGGGGFIPSIYGIVGDSFQEGRAQAIGMFSSIYSLGCIIGPALGGWLLESWSWRSVFWINLPIGVLVFIATILMLKPDRAVKRTSLDTVGAIYFAGALLSLIYFMTRLGQDPSSIHSWRTLTLPVLGLLFLLAFLRRESRVENPILEITLLKSRVFAVMNLLNMVYGACLFGITSFIPYFAMVTYGFSSLASGSLLTGQALGMMGMGVVTSMLLKRTGYRKPMALGFLLIALGAFGMGWYLRFPVFLGREIPPYICLMFMSFVIGLGGGMTSPSSNNAAIELMPDKISAITGIRGMFRTAGGILGVSGVVLMLSLFTDPAEGFRMVFMGMGVLLVLGIPLVREVPDGKT